MKISKGASEWLIKKLKASKEIYKEMIERNKQYESMKNGIKKANQKIDWIDEILKELKV